jgi:DNA-binding CsgD family transcriptional regulator
MGARAEVVLTAEDRETLERWARRPKSAQALALRCRIVLAAADGENTIDIADRLGCTRGTVSKWRGRFVEFGLDGLHDEPRPGKPRTISDDDVERVIVKTLEEQPVNRSRALAPSKSRCRSRATRRAPTRISRGTPRNSVTCTAAAPPLSASSAG